MEKHDVVTVKNISKKENPRIKFGIDREEENQEVKTYLRTGDERIFERVYQRRLRTIEYLAKKYSWLSEDAGSEIRMVLVKTVNGYGCNGKTTDFNTYFFSSVKNHFSNIAKKKYRKKRMTFDGFDPANKTVPLDSFMDDNEGSSQFHELISPDDETTKNKLKMDHYLHMFSDGNNFLFHVMEEMIQMSKRQIVKKDMVFDYSFPLITGDVFVDVGEGVGLPDDMFDVVETKINDNLINAKVKVKSKKLIKFLVKKISEKQPFLLNVVG